MEVCESSSNSNACFKKELCITDLPVEILCNILRCLDGKSLTNASAVDAYWESLCEGDTVLRKRIKDHKTAEATLPFFPKKVRKYLPRCRRYRRIWQKYKFRVANNYPFFVRHKRHHHSSDDDSDQKQKQDRKYEKKSFSNIKIRGVYKVSINFIEMTIFLYKSS